MTTEQKLTILVVEDNSMFRKLAVEMLQDHHVIEAANGKEGLAEYNKHKPNITFLDIGLPDTDGHAILSDILKQNPKAFVTMLTASRLQHDVKQAITNGAKGYIIKPFSRKQIKDIMDKYNQEKK